MKKIITLTLLLSSIFIYAQSGTIDTSFNPTDNGFGSGGGANGAISSVSIQSDNKIIIGGNFTIYNGYTYNKISRLNADGSADLNFTSGTGANNSVSATGIQSDGKIIVSGHFSRFNGTVRGGITRLNSNGTLDTSFESSYGINNLSSSSFLYISDMCVQPDNKIVIIGNFTSYDAVYRNKIARLNADGSLDTSFIVSINTNSQIYSLAMQSDGKIIIGGTFTTINDVARSGIARINTDGSLDTSFNIGTGGVGGVGVVQSIALQSDGKIIFGGSFTTVNSNAQNNIARLNADGSLDPSFTSGTGTNSLVNTISIQLDDKIVIGGFFNTYDGVSRNGIARLNTDGSLDNSYITGTGIGNIINNAVYCSATTTDGKIIFGGEFTSYNDISLNRIGRLTTNGGLDTSFNPSTGANDAVTATTIQPDGKIVFAGNFTAYNGKLRKRIARLNFDGSVDTSFNLIPDFNYTKIFATASQQSGKIVVLGTYADVNGQLLDRIFRLNTDGSVDTSFQSTSGAAATPLMKAIAVQADDKILVGGDFTHYNGIPRSKIARLNSDGSLDTSFDSSIGVNNTGYLNSISVQVDGKIVIGGFFSSYNGVTRNKIARLNTNGSLDTSFNLGVGVGNGEVNSISIQPDGKVIIGGNFTTVNGVSRNRIARLNDNGSLDTSFIIGTGANSTVLSTSIQTNGKIVIGGYFTFYNNTARSAMARLNADGSLDTGFNPGTGFNSVVACTAIQSDGKIILGGYFTSYNGIGKNRILRVNGDDIIITTPAPVANAQTFCQAAKVADLVATGIALQWYDLAFGGTSLVGTTALVTGNYYVTQTLGGTESGRTTVAVTIGSTTTWNGSTWDNGEPISTSKAIFSGNYSAAVNLTACSLDVTGTAVVIVPTGFNFTVSGKLTVASTASLTFENNANLVQVDDIPNEGNITSKRNSNAVMLFDYTMWSSPVDGQQLQSFSPATLANRFYIYNPATDKYNTTTPSANFIEGNGYLIRMPNNHPTSPTVWNGSFTGIPNNGNVAITVTNNTYNAIGNPYPSTIDANAFIDANALTEALYFWRKTNNTATSSYATYTKAGGTANAGGLSSIVPNGIIQVGQGFIAKSTSSALVFSNSLRTVDNTNQFLKTKAIDKHRIWLNLSKENAPVNQIMVAYMSGATAGIDSAIDGKYFNDSPIALISTIEAQEFVIQAKGLPFEDSDVIPLTFKTNANGNYTISIDHVDGLFLGNQDVFVKDNLIGGIYNLKENNYSFSSEIGTFNSRFELVYKSSATLGIENSEFSNSVITFKQNGVLIINAGKMIIKNVRLFDIQGKLIFKQEKVNQSITILKGFAAAKQIVLVQITSDDDKVVTKKVIF